MADHFAHIRGQEQAVRHLSQALAQDKLQHAYLFLGPPGSGKATTA
jgi:DNA polymerase III gamma/tau subunit